MSRLIILLLLALLPGFAWGSGSSVDNNSDQILERIVVPSAEKPQGEVQIIRNGRTLIVRTLIVSTVLKRVVAAIDSKERRRWPESSQGFEASQHYRDALLTVTNQVWERFKKRTEQSELRQYLGIDFIMEGNRGRISLSVPRVSGDYGNFRLEDAVILSTWEVSGDYVRENMVAIVANSFGLEAAAARELLGTRRTEE